MRITIKIKIEIITNCTKDMSLYGLLALFLSKAEIFFTSQDDMFCICHLLQTIRNLNYITHQHLTSQMILPFLSLSLVKIHQVLSVSYPLSSCSEHQFLPPPFLLLFSILYTISIVSSFLHFEFSVFMSAKSEVRVKSKKYLQCTQV